MMYEFDDVWGLGQVSLFFFEFVQGFWYLAGVGDGSFFGLALVVLLFLLEKVFDLSEWLA
jgi:hypothetical protein